EHQRQRAFVAEALTSGEADTTAPPARRAPREHAKASRLKGKLAMAAASLVLLGGAFALAYVVALELGTDRPETPVVLDVGAPVPAVVPPAPRPAVATPPSPIAAEPVPTTAEPAPPRPRRSRRRPEPQLARELPAPSGAPERGA